MPVYIALIHKEDGSDYGVSFPDLPGCVTAGRTLEEARSMAEEALALHLEGLVQDGEAAPELSSLDTIMADHENRDGVVILVEAKGKTPKAMRVNVTLPEDVLREIDRYAEQHGFTRSGFLARAARKMMERDAA